MDDRATRADGLATATDGEPAPPAALCLTSGQLQALQALSPGQMPAEVAAHLASCERCQRAALFGAAEATTRRPQPAPSLGRALLRVVMVLVALAMFLASVRILLS